MTQYISKSEVKAEIERRIKTLDEILSRRPISWPTLEKLIEENKKVLSFLDTLEVKEVDLENEIKEVQRHYKTIEEYEGYPTHIYATGIELIAKHFFELGLNAQVMDKIKWTGDNLKAVISFTGLYKKGFDKWFHSSWKEYEKYVHEHDNVIKIFNPDGTLKMRVSVGTTLIKDYNGIISKSLYGD